MEAIETRVDVAPLVRALEHHGWELVYFDLDLHAQKARVEIKGQDGLHITLDAAPGRRASITCELIKFQNGGKGYGKWQTELLGRSFYPDGPRAALKGLAHYLADNSTRELPRSQAKDLFRPYMG